ncbi:hypothetical protein KIN20_032200 [Parelaphostrongylus tenuis]|uniref:Uncharacterized protein n=1 Tax=Parelaphostrongylus tenuis TaxID=148309 RepID=A0AAD5R6Q5_PARTN|nr:hypothetical protein KIN20_032200 [Parelaphostrongylus tenuis]
MNVFRLFSLYLAFSIHENPHFERVFQRSMTTLHPAQLPLNAQVKVFVQHTLGWGVIGLITALKSVRRANDPKLVTEILAQMPNGRNQSKKPPRGRLSTLYFGYLEKFSYVVQEVGSPMFKDAELYTLSDL